MFLKHIRFGLATVVILTAINSTVKANNLSPQNFDTLYSLAKSENFAVINNAISRGLNIDAVNKNGDTGLCVAAKKRDRKVFRAFARLGANLNHPCTWEINKYQDFVKSVSYNTPIKNMDTATNAKHLTKSMSLKNKLLIGTGVIAAGSGAALAFGGGGGGGSSSDANCVHGYYTEANVCVCYDGYAGSNCSTCAEGYGFYGTKKCQKTLNCGPNGSQQGNICKCNQGYAGEFCDSCDVGYGRAQGKCTRKSSKVTHENVNNNNYNPIVSLEITNEKFADVYGIFYDSAQTPHDYKVDNKILTNYFEDYSDAENEEIEDEDGNTTLIPINITPAKNISIINKNNDSNVFALYSNNAEKIYNAYIKVSGALFEGNAKAYIYVDNKGENTNGNIYGIFGTHDIYSVAMEGTPNNESKIKAYSTIDIHNAGNGNTYGIFNNGKDPDSSNIFHLTKTVTSFAVMSTQLISETTVENTGKGNAYGLYASGSIENSGNVKVIAADGNAYGIYTNGGKIKNIRDDEAIPTLSSLAKSSKGDAYGLYAQGGEIENGRIVTALTTEGSGNAYGIYIEKTKDKDAKLTNTSGIQVESAGGNAYGIYNKGGNVTNSTQYHEITVTAKNGTAYGIYSDGGSVDNSGHIYVYGKDDDNSFGIYATNGATVTNHGEFVLNINGLSANGDNFDTVVEKRQNGYKIINGGYAIYLTNGAKFVNNGNVTSTSALYLGEKGTQLATNGQFSATALAGRLEVANSVVSNGFNDEYVVSDAINAEDVSNLKLSSESVLFDTKLQGSDVILNKKDFDTVVKNKDMAEFLENNYALANNEQLFKELKSKTSAKELNLTLNKISGEDIISRFTNEDLLMQQELDFNINNQLFKLKENNFAFSGNIASNSFDTNDAQTRYAVSGKKIGDMHLGVGMSIAQISSDNGHGNNKRQGQNYQFMMPLQWKNDNGFNTIITPKLAYSYGTYSRDGYNDIDYKGKIEKQLMGVSAQSKYKFDLFGFNITPTSEANLTAYKTKISEDAKQYSLNSEDNLTYSATLGFGAFAEKEYNLSKDNKLNFMFGAMLYHEFANPYNIKLNINGMKGSFALQNETYKDNYMVLRSKFSYDLNNISIYGDFLSHIDSKYRSRIDLGFKYAF